MHDETPDISIVVPVYNTERFLPACLESIDIQGTGSFEVILVDDGSTDGSPEICDAYCNKRERAFVIHKDNEGLLAARRDGLREASGRYILSLDSDDALLEGCIKKVCDVIASTGADIISFDFTMGLMPIKPSLKVDICSGMHTGESFNLCQLLPVFDIAKSLFHIDEPLYYYRQHDANSTKQFKEDQITDWSFVSDELIRYASEWSSDSVKNANRGICRHYCDLDEVLWHCEVDKEVKRQFDKTIKSEYQRRISNCPDYIHGLVLSNCSIVSFAARHILSSFKCLRRLFL